MSIWDTNWKIVRSLHFHTSEFWTELKNELNYSDHFDTLVLISKKITLPLFGLEVETVCSNLDNEQDKLEFIKLVQKWIAASCRCHHDRYYGRMFGTDTFCTRSFCMKKKLIIWVFETKQIIISLIVLLKFSAFLKKHFSRAGFKSFLEKKKFC